MSSSLALSRGSLLNVFSSRRVYQPLWQVIHVYQPDRPLQLVVSDGENAVNCVTLKPTCHVTFNKTEWKIKNSKKTQEEVLLLYNHPVFKIIDFEIAKNETTSIILLTKIKLMGWCKEGRPDILGRETIPLVIPKWDGYTLALKKSDCIDDWERPRFQFTDDGEDGLESICLYNDNQPRNDRKSRGNDCATIKPYSQLDLESGDLAFLGPNYLDVLKICCKCKLLGYQTHSRTAKFIPPTKNFVKELGSLEFLENKEKLNFCVCDDENEKFREEFQSKCIVVNQETSNTGNSSKVQCILIGKNSAEDEKKKKKFNSQTRHYESKGSELDPDFVLPVHTPRSVKYSRETTVCEHCGVEDVNMASCRQCQKVFYCSNPCKRADVKEHATVCRAFITVRRYGEERVAWGAKLREPEDGCATCGFWRDSLKDCKICKEVAFCCSSCLEKGEEKHKPVCHAHKLIQDYTLKLSTIRASEMD